MVGVGKEIAKAVDQTGREVVIEKKFHDGTTIKLFSRSAA
jgi:hypothetical protein